MVDSESATEQSASRFQFIRIESTRDIPPTDAKAIDVAVLDMHHGRPNLSHDSVVSAVRLVSGYFRPFLSSADLTIRVLSYDVRGTLVIPEPPGGRFSLYIGTGGPGHFDPRRNDGEQPWSQGVRDDVSWEGALFKLFEAISDTRDVALIGICYTFGLLCRWSGVAHPRVRGGEKGGRSSGARENVLSIEAAAHPWFSRFARELGSTRFRVMEDRMFDLVPAMFPDGITPLAWEPADPGYDSDAVTMVEFARDRRNVMPRIWGMQFHPEIIDRKHALAVVEKKRERREVSEAWYRERIESLSSRLAREDFQEALRLTAQHTLLLPLEYHVARLVRLRRESLGYTQNFEEDQMLREFIEEEEMMV